MVGAYSCFVEVGVWREAFRQLRTLTLVPGYSDYQVYLMLSCAPIQGHVGGLVDIPNACMTLGLPMDIFDFDISPTGPAKKIEMGACAVASK